MVAVLLHELFYNPFVFYPFLKECIVVNTYYAKIHCILNSMVFMYKIHSILFFYNPNSS